MLAPRSRLIVAQARAGTVIATRYFLIALTSLALVAAGCGSDDDEPTRAGAVTQQEDRNPAKAPPAILNGALTTMRQVGLSAARELDDVSEDDLRPSERGAELLIARGLVDEERFCTAVRIAVEAEASAEAQSRFASGWRASAPGARRRGRGDVRGALNALLRGLTRRGSAT